jgi:hypothetical protein
MRKLILLICFAACTVTGAFGQRFDDLEGARRHKISVSIGAAPITPGREFADLGFSNYDGRGSDALLQYYGNNRFYRGAERSFGAVTLSYGYRFLKWLEFGVDIAYTNISYRKYDINDHSFVSNGHTDYWSVMPTVRLFWVRGKHINLYSSLGIGYTNSSYDNYDESRCGAQFNYFGISLGGNRVFGFAEFGVGRSGLVSAGIGVRL